MILRWIWDLDEGDLSPGWRWDEIIDIWSEINVSHPFRSNSFQSRSLYLRPTSIQVTPHLHPGNENCMSCSCKSHLKPMSYLYSGPASPVSSSQDSCLTSIHVSSHLHPGPKILLLLSSISRFTPMQVPSHPNPGQNMSFIPSTSHLIPI